MVLLLICHGRSFARTLHQSAGQMQQSPFQWGLKWPPVATTGSLHRGVLTQPRIIRGLVSIHSEQQQHSTALRHLIVQLPCNQAQAITEVFTIIQAFIIIRRSINTEPSRQMLRQDQYHLLTQAKISHMTPTIFSETIQAKDTDSASEQATQSLQKFTSSDCCLARERRQYVQPIQRQDKELANRLDAHGITTGVAIVMETKVRAMELRIARGVVGRIAIRSWTNQLAILLRRALGQRIILTALILQDRASHLVIQPVAECIVHGFQVHAEVMEIRQTATMRRLVLGVIAAHVAITITMKEVVQEQVLAAIKIQGLIARLLTELTKRLAKLPAAHGTADRPVTTPALGRDTAEAAAVITVIAPAQHTRTVVVVAADFTGNLAKKILRATDRLILVQITRLVKALARRSVGARGALNRLFMQTEISNLGFHLHNWVDFGARHQLRAQVVGA